MKWRIIHTLTSGTKMSGKRYEFIDSLRGIAIIAVIVTHVGALTLSETSGSAALLKKLTNLGGMGVPLFYLVSAFTIMLLFTKRRVDEPRPIGSFYIRRVMRIAPVYWTGIIGYSAIYGLTASRGWLEAPELWHYPMHALFLNMTTPFTPSTVVPGGWSISNEMIFYAIFPALYFLADTPKKSIAFFIVCIGLSPLAENIAASIVSHFFPGSTDTQAKQFAYRWLPNQLSCFAAGFMFFHLFTHINSNEPKPKFNGARVAILGCLAAIPFAIFSIGNGPFHYNHLWVIWFFVLATGMFLYKWPLLVNAPLAWVGKVSFSCYIVHFAVIELVHRALPTLADIQDFSTTLAIAFPLTLILSWLSYRYFESYFMRCSTRLVDAFQRPARSGETAVE